MDLLQSLKSESVESDSSLQIQHLINQSIQSMIQSKQERQSSAFNSKISIIKKKSSGPSTKKTTS